MDPSYVNHHRHNNHSRHVPFSPPPPPLQPPSPLSHHHPPLPPPPYQQSLNNLYASRHHLPRPKAPPQLRPLAPPRPPQQQQQLQQLYHRLPAPSPPLPRQQLPNHRPYNPHNPQHTSNTNFNSNPIPNNVSHQFRDFPQWRVPVSDTHPDYLSDNRVSTPRLVSNLEREAHYHQFVRRPASPGIDRFRHDLEGSSRLRDPELNQREREALGRVHGDRWISNRPSRDFGIDSMCFEMNSNNSGLDHEVTENMRRGLCLRDQLIDNGNNDTNERDEMRVVSRKNDYDTETERFTERRGSREGSHELNRTPRKQMQKKSAFLRIQKVKPNHRSTGDERLHFSGYYSEGKTGTCRGKDLVLHSDHAMEEKAREGSPVELDVSFKSNSLVAKAIMTPSSAPISDSNVQPRNTKIRRVVVIDKGCSNLQPNNANQSGAKLDGSTSVLNSGSCSKDSKKSEGKVKTANTVNVQDGITNPCSKGTNVSLRKGKLKKSPKLTVKFDDSSCAVTQEAPISDKKPESLDGKGTIPCVSSMVDGGAQTCSDWANVSVGLNKVGVTLKSTVSDKTGANGGKPSSIKATKKKTIVRKVVKKVTNSPLNLENSGSAKKGDQPVKADTSALLSATSVAYKSDTPLQMKIASAAVHSVPGVLSECCPKESAVLFEYEKVNGVQKEGVSKEVDTDVDPSSSVAPKIERERHSLAPPLSSSGHEVAKADQGSVNADNSVHGLPIISNVKEDCMETPNESVISGTHIVEDVNKQFYNIGLSGSEDIEVHGVIVDIGSSSVAMHSSTGFDCCSSNTSEINIACDIGNVNSGSKQVCAIPGSSVVQDSSTRGFPQAKYSVESNKMPHLPWSEESQINSGSIHADCSNHNRSTICTPDIGYVNSRESNHEIGDAFVKHLSQPTLSFGNYGTEGIPNAAESLECRDQYAANVRTRKVAIAELYLSSSTFTNISVGPTDVLTSANCLDTTVHTAGINTNPAEVMVSGIQWLDVGLQHSRDKVSVLHQSSSNDTLPKLSASADGRSPEKKKRKIATSSSSVTASVISQGVAVSDISKSALQLASNFSADRLQLEKEVKVSSKDGLDTEGTGLLLINSSVVGPSPAVGSFRDAYSDDHPSIDLSLAFVESVAPSSPLLKLGGEKLSTVQPLPSVNNHQIDAMDIEGDDRVKVHDTAEDLKIISSEVVQCRITPEHKSVSLDQRLPITEEENDNHLPLKDNLPSASNSLVFGVDAQEVFATYSSGEAMSAPDTPSDEGSPVNHDNLVISTSTCKAPFCQKSEEKACGDEKLSDDIFMTEGACNSSAIVSSSQHSSKTILKSNDVIQTNQSVAGKAGLLPSHDSKNIDSPNFLSGETHGRKNLPSHGVPKSSPTPLSFVLSASKNTTSSAKITKPRTWHRTHNSSATLLSGNKPSSSANTLQKQLPKKSASCQSTSYIRKGNSLFRKPVSVPALPQGSHSLSSSVYRVNSGVADEVSKGTVPNSEADAVDLTTGGTNTSFKSPTMPPLSSVTEVPNRASNSSGECTSPPLAEPFISDCCETTTDHPSCMEINNVLNSPEEMRTSETLNRIGSVNNLEVWTEQNEGDLAPSNAKRVTYVKPKSNTLIATSDCGHISILNAHKNQPFSASSDGDYKKSKNQLIRTALESQIKQVVSMSDDKTNSVVQVADKAISSRTFGKRRSSKVVAKTHKPSKFSLVWTLHSARLSNNDGNSLPPPKVLPQLFPSKRTSYKRSFSWKMLLLRKRNTVYTRSIKGFSTQKSKVLSVGGSSLKWSKSVERRSRKANAEATPTVAEAERKKRERNGTVSGTGKRSQSCHKVIHGTELRPGERVFRIGSVRYKMDSSRRSLQRILEGKSSCSAGHLSENSTKKSYVPRRLVIGNDEYVRIGNGNQLVRDPKKRTRVLASEKVRWSLRTARLQLVKKQYCQFFTRFGKCNKDDGKCPYIHDPSKIAVCTKFLKGLCSNTNCKLTHKVIPERMPDCSYFLQGVCTNENCPYRHIHVNPNASTCEGFLRGYCADGNECRKTHSYVCPIFEATGSCSQGSKCNLHHPKKRSKAKKSNRSTVEHKNAIGRYFGIDISEPKRMVSERHQTLDDDDDDIFFDGKFSDYIRLDVSDDEDGEIHQVMCDQTTFGDNDSSDFQLDDLDELIKPIRIMKDDSIISG